MRYGLIELAGSDGSPAGRLPAWEGFGVKRGDKWAHPAHGRQGSLRDYPYVYRLRSHASACANRYNRSGNPTAVVVVLSVGEILGPI